MIFKFIGNSFRYFRIRYNSFENVFQILGAILGFIVSIVLIMGGIAAIPFTGGASLLPMWVGALIFVGVLTTTFLAAGRMLGVTIDTIFDIINGVKINNEKLATAVAFVVALVLASLALPLHFVAISYVASAAIIPLWEVLLIFFPVMLATLTAVGRHIGRTIDRHVLQSGNIYDFCKEIYEYCFGIEKPDIAHSHLDVNATKDAAIAGIDVYLQNRDQTDLRTHLGVFARNFDVETGLNRADVYYYFLTSERVTSDLQYAIILYTMLNESNGVQLKKTISNSINGTDDVEPMVKELHTYIYEHVKTDNAREYLKENIISKLGLFANHCRKVEDDNGQLKDNYRLVFNHLNDERFAHPMT